MMTRLPAMAMETILQLIVQYRLMSSAQGILTLDPRNPVQALNAGLFISGGRGTHPRRIIDSHEIILVRTGHLSMREARKHFQLSPGQSLILHSGREHAGDAPYPPDLSFYWLHFRLRPSLRHHSHGLLRPQQYVTLAHPDRLAELMHRYMDEQESSRLQPDEADLLATLMLCRIAHDAVPATAKQDSEPKAAAILVGQARQYIASHYTRPISTRDVACALECNPDYLSRIFYRLVGMSILTAIHHHRVEHARRLLRDSTLRLKEIVLASGFTNSTYFCRRFLAQEGLTPISYRKLYAQAHVNTL